MAKKAGKATDKGSRGPGAGAEGAKAKEPVGKGIRGDVPTPWWLPPVLYAVVTLFLFRKFVFSGDMLLGGDTLALGYMAREFFAQALKGGTFPFWNPIILGGTPFLDSLAGGDSLYPTSLLLLLMEPFRALGWKLVIHVFLAGLFTYGWIRALGRSRAASLLCGLAYLMAPFMVTLVYPGHDGKLFVTALTPLLFWATERGLARGSMKAFGSMALTIGLIILTTHFQQAYFLFGGVGVYALVRTFLLKREGMGGGKAGIRFVTFLGFSLVGAGVGAIQLLPAVDYVTESSRRTATTTRASAEGSVAYSSSWSLHPEEVAAFLVPEFVGSNAGGAAWTENTYWGRNPVKYNHEYAGFVVLLLAGLAFFGAPSRGIRFTLLGIGGVALLYGLGAHTPVWRVFYGVVPGISLFRAPSIAAFLFGFAGITLMAFGIDWVLDLGQGPGKGKEMGGSEAQPEGARDKGLLIYLASAVGILFLATLLASSGTLTSAWTALLYGDMGPGKADALARAQPFITRGCFIATGLAGGTLGLAWAVRKGKASPLVWTVGIGLLLVLDMGRVNDPFIQTFDFQQWSAVDPNVQFLLDRSETEDPFRVLAMGGGQAGQDVKPGMYGLELAAGHHPNDLARYRELIGMAGSGVPMNFFDPETAGPNVQILSILNVRYLIWPAYQFGALPEGIPVMGTSLGEGRPYETVYEIPTLPRARLVGEVRVLDEAQVVPYLLSPEFRPAEEVVLEAEPPVALSDGPVEGRVEWVEKGLNRHLLRVRSDGPALLVLAENWYPAWKARVGGEEAPVLRANHTLRAVPVPAGENEVEVFFDKAHFRVPLFVTLASLLLVVFALLMGSLKPGVPGQGEDAA